MKVDAYTKIVLTLIAACLVWLCVTNVTVSEPASAQMRPPAQEVIIAGVKTPNGFLPVTISGAAPGARLPVILSDIATPDRLLPVKIWGIQTPNQQLPVSIHSVKKGTEWDALSVKTADK